MESETNDAGKEVQKNWDKTAWRPSFIVSACMTGLRCFFVTLFLDQYLILGGPGGSVGIAAGYVLDGPGIESRWGRDFPHLSRPALGPPSLLYNGYRVFAGCKAARA